MPSTGSENAQGPDTAEDRQQQQGGGDAHGLGGGEDRRSSGGGDERSSVQWDAPLLETLNANGLINSIQRLQVGFDSVFKDAGTIGRHHFANRMVKVSGKTVVLGETAGDERVEGVTAFAGEIIAGMGSGTTVNREAVISTIYTLISELCPEVGKRLSAGSGGDRTSADHDSGADRDIEANRALAVAFATEAAGAEKRKREMAADERQNRLKSWHSTLSASGTPNPNDCPHLQQCKTLTDEIEGGLYPVKPSASPLRMCDLEDVHKQAGKDEDIVGADTKNVLTGRTRIDRWVSGIVVAAAKRDDRAEIVGGAYAIAKAVRNATNVTNMDVLSTVMNTAMAEGRKAYDGEYGPSVTLGQAFQVAARTVARQDAAIAVQVAAARTSRETGKEKKERTTFNVKLPDGKKKAYKILAGGNPDCPMDCKRKSCTKNSKCAFNHRNLA